jgi:tRNA pseudouridine55 synthase
MVFTREATEADFQEDMLILVDKPLDWTSFDVVNKVRFALRKFFPNIKVGHAGSLDPKATGLLVLATGKMTKQIIHLQGLDKTYTGTMKLGATTPCYDSEMAEDQHFDISDISPTMLDAAALSLTGNIAQVPPVYSAIKKDGQTAYKAARKGQEIELLPRPLTIHHFRLTRVALPYIDFDISCSKGTYIRAIARDFGKIMNNGAYLTALSRTSVGTYRLEDAWNLSELISFISQIKRPHARPRRPRNSP